MKHVDYYETSDGKRFYEKEGRSASASQMAWTYEIDIKSKPLFDAKRSAICACVTYSEAKEIVKTIRKEAEALVLIERDKLKEEKAMQNA